MITPSPLNIYLIGMPFTTVFSLALGSFVLYKKPSNPVNQTWFLACLAVGSWSAFFCLMVLAREGGRALLYTQLTNFSASYIPAFLTHFCIAITKSRSKRLLAVSYINCVIFAVFSFTPWMLHVRPIGIFHFYPAAGPLYYFFTLNFYFYVLYQQYLLIKSLRYLPEENKNQIKFIIVALALGHLGGVLTFMPVFDIPINPLTANFVWLYAAVVSYAIIKHGLMDITIVFRKGLIYSSLIGIITALYFLVVYFSSTIFQNFLGYKSWGSILVTSIGIALIFKPLERKVQDLVDTYIFRRSPELLEKENYRLREEVQKQDRLKAIATLAAGMAHEIKNPLTSIKTFAEYLPSKYDDPEFREKFQRIVVDEVDRVNNIIKQLLDFSKPEKVTTSNVSLSLVIEETLSLLNSNLIKNKIQLTKKFDQGILIRVDRNLIKQALLNLFLNAVQAMPDGGLLGVESLVEDGLVKIKISDSGTGISNENIPLIFNPFFTTKEEGTGLGLSIVHGIINEHGGTIQVESKVGKGTTVSVLLKNRN